MRLNIQAISSESRTPPPVVPTTADLCASALAAVGNVAQLRDGDLHVVAQLFVEESHVQQAALFGMEQSGSILQSDCMVAPLKIVKEPLQANTGVSFLGEKRSRPTGDQLPMHNKKPNGFVKKAGCSANITCLTCLKTRDDNGKVCKVCCACCTCVPRKDFAKCAQFYAAAPAEGEPVVHWKIQLLRQLTNHQVMSLTSLLMLTMSPSMMPPLIPRNPLD